MTYAEQLDALRAAEPGLGAQVASLRNLEAILKWAPSAGIDFKEVDLIQQDEYSYDLLLPLPDGRWLNFGVSWFGELAAVAAWDNKPTADEVLARRVRLGWSPTCSLLKAGPTVLGHAATLKQ